MNGHGPRAMVGLNWYPTDAQGQPQEIHLLPYTFGIREPYAGNPAGTTFEGQYNAAYAHGAYDGASRVGLAGLVLGAGLGIVGMILLRKREK